jgi:hypothetical protein
LSSFALTFDRGEDWLQAPEFIRGKNFFFLNFKPPDLSVGKIQNPKSKIQNPKSKIQNPKSKIQNPKSK